MLSYHVDIYNPAHDHLVFYTGIAKFRQLVWPFQNDVLTIRSELKTSTFSVNHLIAIF